ncbi:hypothetical protein AMS68_006515 [Peltaster fructicola]|uniref:F-box domain-containing protein n=1 Tax=Peltaster fructicola TaxID=286661 RepID=A0A6H0Y2C1_9PEZI|nr:hypothetical protein AMS68_006515 [Peltaster fructicola]
MTPQLPDEIVETELPSPRLRSSRTWKTRGTGLLNEMCERKKPLGLLDLPVDVLKEIVREVTHTNDLTSLALCHSALHRLTIPHIYSRFDIVWPDTNTHAEPRSGVDALTYGLATLVMAEEIFGEAPSQRHDANRFTSNGRGRATEMTVRKRRGNHYAQYTKKFSLGNGPADWVQEYLITKEGGKMLGTLVALAVARMRSLETFVWDMPTGVLRDVWLSLSSLAERNDGQECRLQKVWVRWHDNSPAESILPPPPPPPYAPPPLQPVGSPMMRVRPAHQVRLEDLDHVEHPSFSMLPALRSLSVLDIDELAYLDEMAVLIERSLDKLRELRIGIARHAISRDWVTPWEGDEYQQVDLEHPTIGSLTVGEKRRGGVLGTLTGLIHDLRKPELPLSSRARCHSSAKADVFTSTHHHRSNSDILQPIPASSWTGTRLDGADSLQTLAPDDTLENDPLIASSRAASPQPQKAAEQTPSMRPDIDDNAVDEDMPFTQQRLQLEILELERIPLCIDVLHQAFDWSKLTCLTILHCQNHEALWKTLRRTFAPIPRSPSNSSRRRTSSASPKKLRSSLPTIDIEMAYPLSLKRVHTNTVSPALISFLKETLAPNSLEVLFLQEVRSYASSVTIESIFKGPLRRHRASLKKLLIDSSEKGPDGVPTNSSRWRRWMLNREILTFVCSGKMPRLRELGMAIEYRDWHFFLQHLPSVPHLRSLYMPFIADHVHGADVDPKELALQIVDIVALRPEVEICYMGIANKCFEILENRHGWDTRPESAYGHLSNDLSSSDHGDDDDDPADDDDEPNEDDRDDTESEISGDDADSDIVEASNHARLRLREILFYDDKVAVFRARHGRL